ncbi:hypothetical protein [Vibrio phage nt-1]|uniref:Uncharacterized protein n=1 Tax=Vibrio phage nt-1 TaxID=115992 RepID=A0A068JBR6_9CAUD|nr:hypothetical protein VPFG_p09 [Vibrio phage nt-1]AIE13781.1 hypothetical protein [Vibrio phage nt-1]
MSDKTFDVFMSEIEDKKPVDNKNVSCVTR